MADTDKTVGDAIRAAGGLVWRHTPRGKELLLVHRQRYDDWTLPKGKQEAGENLVEAAVREVREETGYEAQIDSFAGVIAYEVDGRPKVVSFWQMRVEGEPISQIDGEVADVIWLPVDQALERLQYPLEKALVDALRQEEDTKR